MDVITVEIEGVRLEVYYEFIGNYYPATHEQPEEKPELEIYKICVEDSEINIYQLLVDWQFEIIENKIWKESGDR